MRIVKINNSTDCYGLVPLKGWQDNILSPAQRKNITYNDNVGINGTRAVIKNRRVDKREFSISFYLRCDGEYERYVQLLEVEQLLNAGMNNTGVNDLQIEIGGKKLTIHAIMESLDKYEGMGGNRAIITVKFVEINPADRTVV